MIWLKAAILGLIVAVAASCAVGDTVVYEEHFSAPFVVHDWPYNNSGSNNCTGYPGNIGGLTQPWPAGISEDGHEILGYYPTKYGATNFESYAEASLGGQDGWIGAGTVVLSPSNSHSFSKSARFTSDSAYKNVTSTMQRSVQYVQCYVMSPSYGTLCFIYAGTTDLASVAAAVRLNTNGKIEALNGNGSGGGTWVAIGSYLANQWYRITIKLDYTTHTFRAAVQGGYKTIDFGFRDSAAYSDFQAIGFAANPGYTFYMDDVYAGNSPYAPGQDLAPYWSQTYNHWCIDYGGPLHDAYDTYDWMSCSDLFGNPVNTDPDRAPAYKASLPAGWTAAIQPWADEEPQNYVASGRGKMGFTRLMGQYAQQADNPCLHVWSSQGNLRVVSPNITTGPGIYTLSFRAGVWNLNTSNPAQQSLWTDWCSWGFGYTNWCAWDPWTADQGYLQSIPPFPKSLDWMGIDEYWNWPRTPFAGSNPHPVGEEPGQWHSFSNTFAFGMPPDQLVTTTQGRSGSYSGRGYYVGFNVAHAHDPWNTGYEWGTILNVDDIVLTKKDPVEIGDVRTSPVDTLVEVSDLVITNMVYGPNDLATGAPVVRVFLEKPDRSAAIMVRATGDQTKPLWDDEWSQFKMQVGDVVRVVGAVSLDDPNYKSLPQPDKRNPMSYITSSAQYPYLPAVVPTGAPQIQLKPVAMTNKALAGKNKTPQGLALASGLGAEGMLVTVFGRVNHSNGLDYFYVDDGSGITAGKFDTAWTTNATGIRIDCRTAMLDLNYLFAGAPADGSYAAVTGTYTAEKPNPNDHTTVVRVVYPRLGSDIVTF